MFESNADVTGYEQTAIKDPVTQTTITPETGMQGGTLAHQQQALRSHSGDTAYARLYEHHLQRPT